MSDAAPNNGDKARAMRDAKAPSKVKTSDVAHNDVRQWGTTLRIVPLAAAGYTSDMQGQCIFRCPGPHRLTGTPSHRMQKLRFQAMIYVPTVTASINAAKFCNSTAGYTGQEGHFDASADIDDLRVTLAWFRAQKSRATHGSTVTQLSPGQSEVRDSDDLNSCKQ